MKVIKGQHNFAKIYTDEVEQTAVDQIELLCDQPWTKRYCLGYLARS